MLAMFKTPTALALAKQELEDARRAQLQAHSALESAQATLAYQNARVVRLEAYVNAHKEAVQRAGVQTPIPSIDFDQVHLHA